jgi:hypothetical protein
MTAKFGEGSAGPTEDSEKQDACNLPGFSGPAATFDPQRSSAADSVLQQLEDHGIPDGEIVERCAVLEVASMEIDLAFVSETDEPVALPNQQLHDAAR